MDILIGWFESVLKAGLPTATVAAIFGLGVVVTSIVATVKTVWKTASSAALMGLVFVVSALLVTVVFLQSGIDIRTHAVYLAVSVVVVSASAVYQHQAVKTLVRPAVKMMIRK